MNMIMKRRISILALERMSSAKLSLAEKEK
jgi:hypothetical protein